MSRTEPARSGLAVRTVGIDVVKGCLLRTGNDLVLAIGAHRGDDSAACTLLLTFLQRGKARAGRGIARHQRPAAGRMSESGALGTKERQHLGALGRVAARLVRGRYGSDAGLVVPRHTPALRRFREGDGAPRLEAADRPQAPQHALGELTRDALSQLALELPDRLLGVASESAVVRAWIV